MLYCGAADCTGIHTHAVDEYQRVIAIGAAQENRCSLSGAAITTDIDTGFEAQEFCEVSGERQFDVVPGNYLHRDDRIVERDLGACRGYHNCVPGRNVSGQRRLRGNC